MTIPVYIPDHVAKGLALLTEQFKGKPNIEGLLKSWLAQFQSLEDVYQQIVSSRSLQGVGVQLDILGSLVGERRLGRTDDSYKLAISVRILVNGSDGSNEDLQNILLAILATQGIAPENAKNYLTFEEYFPARFRVYSNLSSATNANIIAAMQVAKSAGVAFNFQGNGNTLLQHEIVYDHTTPGLVPVGYANGSYAHTSGTAADNTPVHVQ